MAMAQREVDTVRSLLLGDDTLVRGVAAGRRRNHTTDFRRVELRYVDLDAGRQLQVTSFDETQAHTRNLPLDAAAAEVDRLLAAGYANWHVDTVTERTQLRFTKKGRALLHQAPAAPA
ncbi:MAG TPA: hypothetical protein VFJ97_08175, partial [Dermatophilaceae bacterium]|nr:hypothetical protein [Dermatophilaceae bacterium]